MGSAGRLELNIALWKGGYGEAYADSADPGLLRITVSDVLDAVMQFDTAADSVA